MFQTSEFQKIIIFAFIISNIKHNQIAVYCSICSSFLKSQTNILAHRMLPWYEIPKPPPIKSRIPHRGSLKPIRFEPYHWNDATILAQLPCKRSLLFLLYYPYLFILNLTFFDIIWMVTLCLWVCVSSCVAVYYANVFIHQFTWYFV